MKTILSFTTACLLAGAAAAGLRTAFIARPDEHGPGRGESTPGVPVDIAVDSVIELAHALQGAVRSR